MLSQYHVNQYNESIVIEVQDLKKQINEVKKSDISEENSLLLENLDIRLSKKLKNYIIDNLSVNSYLDRI